MPTTATITNLTPAAASRANPYLATVTADVTATSGINPVTGVTFTSRGRTYVATSVGLGGGTYRWTARVIASAGRTVSVTVDATTADANVNSSSWSFDTRRVMESAVRADLAIRGGLASAVRVDWAVRASGAFENRVDWAKRPLGLETLGLARVDYAVRENAYGFTNAFEARSDVLVVEDVQAAFAPVGANIGEHGGQPFSVSASINAVAYTRPAPVGMNATGTTRTGLVGVGANVVDARADTLVSVGFSVGEWAAGAFAVAASIAPTHALAILEIVVASTALQAAEDAG